MATLNLTQTFINLLATGEAVSGNTMDGRTATYDRRGEVRIYATGTQSPGGRSRSITRQGAIGTFVFTFRDMTRTQIDTLKVWTGQPVQVRDDRSRIFYGVFYAVPEQEHRKHEETLYDVPMVISTVTVVEGV